MANGIDWFRWHHGSVTDPKFQLVAKKAGVRLGDVLVVWAFVLESASANHERGTIGQIDFETLDFLIGAEDGSAIRILDAMTQRGLISGSCIAKWDERQPKREDESASERKRRQREREHELKMQESVTKNNVTDEASRNVTQSHADVTQSHDREEESREDIEVPTVLVGTATPNRLPPCPNQEIVDLYHANLPSLPRVEILNDSRKRAISARWREVCTDNDIRKAADVRRAALDWFAWYFDFAAKSRFLTGRAKDWRADFDFLMTPTKFAKVLEGHYHKEAA